jgi:hypothetical protein
MTGAAVNPEINDVSCAGWGRIRHRKIVSNTVILHAEPPIREMGDEPKSVPPSNNGLALSHSYGYPADFIQLASPGFGPDALGRLLWR